ncbi:MAG TPA: hypothetical protein VIR62_10155 [Allosphingosinicella sp.]
MKKLGGIAAAGGVSLAAISLLLAPALAATTQKQDDQKARSAPSLSIGGFTPAVADPRLAAELARRGLPSGSFRFTPTTGSRDKSKAVKVAVRARASTTAEAARTVAGSSASAITAITPTAYNLGVSVGWKRFAISGDIAKVDGGVLPGGSEAAEVGVSYTGKNFAGRVMVGAQRNDAASILPTEESYSLDVGGSYSITRNLDVTGGVRYKIQRDRLEPLADERRDSQAVYIGTAFRF